MSLLVTGIRLPFDEPETAALDRARRLTGLLSSETEAAVCRVSIDARRGQISRVYSVRLDAPCDEKALAEKLQMPSVRYKENARPAVPHGEKRLAHRPVVVGLGPAGLFAAYTLARHGFRPIVLERGGDMDERDRAVDTFWSGGALDPDCNIQFGEGGAGAYSDGKLTTRIGDALCETVLETLAAHGAPADIVKKAKPHVGTDILKDVVREMRREIVKNGGEVHFRTALTGVSLKNGALTAVRADGMDIPCERAVIAVGHSARDTFLALHENGVYFEPKAFSVGVRIEHAQKAIDRSQYGAFASHPALGAAEYKLAVHLPSGRGVYTFCMCPGGEVVCAASERDGVVVNGMSRYARDGANANSALLVGVDPSDFPGDDVLAGVEFQQRIERAAYRCAIEAGGSPYAAPASTVGDFLAGGRTAFAPSVSPTCARGVAWCNLRECLPGFVADAIAEALPLLDRKLHGFADPQAVLTGVETRSSSPVRIVRDSGFQASLAGSAASAVSTAPPASATGLYPCGEGAGYAGGIMSAAVDGLRVAEALAAEAML